MIDDKITCAWCGDDFDSWEVIYLKGYAVCIGCRDEVDICSACEELVSLDYSKFIEGELYCNECLGGVDSDEENGDDNE